MVRLSKGLLPLAAILAVSAAGSRAQAGNVDTITTHLVNLTVTDPTTQASYPTIAQAVVAADPGETVRVGPGTYNESVDITKPLTLLGAKANVSGVTGRPVTGEESVLDFPGTALVLAADNITVNGFTFSGNSVSGVNMLPQFSGYQILDNVFQGNAVGLEAASVGTNQTAIRGNLFSNNNLDEGESFNVGYGILTNGFLSNTVIEENKFTGHNFSAAYLTASNQLTIDDNEFREDTALVLANVTNGAVTNNLFVDGDDLKGQLGFLANNSNITVTGNRFLNNASAGVAFPTIIQAAQKAKKGKVTTQGKGNPFSRDVHVNGNDFIGNGSAILVESFSYDGTLDAELNYYGSSSGPQAKGNPKGTGDAVIGDVDYVPWLRRSIVDQGSPATDITNRLIIYKGLPFTLPGRPGIYATVTVINKGRSTLRGPFTLVISGVTGGAQVVSANGFTSLIQPHGSPFVDLAGRDLAPGEIAMATVRYTGRQRDFRYKVRVFSGDPDDKLPPSKL